MDIVKYTISAILIVSIMGVFFYGFVFMHEIGHKAIATNFQCKSNLTINPLWFALENQTYAGHVVSQDCRYPESHLKVQGIYEALSIIFVPIYLYILFDIMKRTEGDN